jgi:hypothetical protein
MGVEVAALDNPALGDAAFERHVSAVQRQIRWWLVRRHRAAQKLQAAMRGMLIRRNLKRMRDSATLIQSLVRRHQAQREYRTLRNATLTIQSNFRERHAKRFRGADAAEPAGPAAAPGPGEGAGAVAARDAAPAVREDRVLHMVDEAPDASVRQ